jgi:hypothetical protein
LVRAFGAIDAWLFAYEAAPFITANGRVSFSPITRVFPQLGIDILAAGEEREEEGDFFLVG